jgi:hypothetical protein
MKPELKDEFQVAFTKALMRLGEIKDPIVQGVALFRELSTIIDNIYDAGRIDGFNEAYKKAAQETEKKYSKRN